MKGKCAVISIRGGSIVDFSFDPGVEHAYGIAVPVENDEYEFSAVAGSEVILPKSYIRRPVFYKKEIKWNNKKIKDSLVEGYVEVDENIEEGAVKVYSVDGKEQRIERNEVIEILSWYDAISRKFG